ncbi:MAG: hypothetical protein KBA61_13915 [Spirochaetes bacterium]|nr:hypothetical protein [Spirochaetota bacterium]
MKNNKPLSSLLESGMLPGALLGVFNALKGEDAKYAADEVVAAGEELLAFLSALSVQVYLHSSNQREDMNRIALDVLRGTMGPNPNAGAYFWRAMKLLAVCGDLAAGAALRGKIMKPDGHYYLARDEFMELSRHRNRIMHGIFIQPAEKNHADAENLCSIAEQLFGDGFFKPETREGVPYLGDICLYPLFAIKEGTCLLAQDFTVLKNPEDYQNLLDRIAPDNAFKEELALIMDEFNMKFLDAEMAGLSELARERPPQSGDLVERLLGAERGAVLVEGGYGAGKTALWAGTAEELRGKPGIIVIAFRMKTRGLLYSGKMVNRVIAEKLKAETGVERSKNENDFSYIIKAVGASSMKVFLLIDDIHLRHGAQDHLLEQYNDYYNSGIRVVGFTAAYPPILHCFNERFPITSPPRVADDAVLEKLARDYVCETGPFPGQGSKEDESFSALLGCVKKLYGIISRRKSVDLRGSAVGGKTYSLLEEAAHILTPFAEHASLDFEKDEADPITGFPVTVTEATYPYRVMKRRDLGMEYRKHVLRSALPR